MAKIVSKIAEETKKLIPPTLFFFIALHLAAFVRVLMLKGTGISLGTTASVTIAALVLGKAVLLADLLPGINRFPEKPLIYNIAWKTVLYFFMALLLHYLENLIQHWRETGSFVLGNEKLMAEIIWPHFFAIQLFLLVLILIYCTMHELIRLIGGYRMRCIFFGPLDQIRDLLGKH